MKDTGVVFVLCALAFWTAHDVQADSQSYLRSSANSTAASVAEPGAPAAHRVGPFRSAALTWFDNKADFEAAAGALICVQDFEESTLPPSRIIQFVDELASGVPCQPQGNCPFPNGLEGCDDMVYQSNGLGGTPNVPNPAPGGFVLDALSAGFGGVTSDVIIMDRFPMSVDVLIRRDDVFAFGATPVTLQGGQTIEIRGAWEGWTVAPQMGRAGVSAIITPRDRVMRDERDNRANGSSIENAAILHAQGVPLAIVPSNTAITTWGVAGRDLLHLAIEAGFGIRGGLPQDAALKAVTIDAARILGVDHRVGSIEIGKDADFAITDADILHYMTLVRWTVVNGRIAYDKEKDSLYKHIRPDEDRDKPAPTDYWPRRLGAD